VCVCLVCFHEHVNALSVEAILWIQVLQGYRTVHSTTNGASKATVPECLGAFVHYHPGFTVPECLGAFVHYHPGFGFCTPPSQFCFRFFLINIKYKTQIGIQTRGYTFWNFLCAGPNPLSGDWTQPLVVFNIVLSPTLKGVTSLQKLENVWSLRQA
jgi:hypothetical protein